MFLPTRITLEKFGNMSKNVFSYAVWHPTTFC